MDSPQVFVALMFAAALLIGVAQKLRIPYPIALVIGGAAIGFIPGLDGVYLNPNSILLLVLPPILYYASFEISFREFKNNWREIFSLALGLVVVTTFVVGVIFKWLFPEYPWALAFTFGAIVSPPDAIAVTAILKRFKISPHLLAVLEGESLINDASAIVLYRLGVVALLSGTFSLGESSFEFVKVVSGGVAVGLILGAILQGFSFRYLDPVVGVVFSLTIPYITYITADFLGVSGVLAVVVVGLIGSRALITHRSSLRRILGHATWDIFTILLNCFVFILIGLHVGPFINAMTIHQIVLYAGYALLITCAMIIVRVIWVFTKSAFAYVKALYSPKSYTRCPQILREATLISWSGMRGIVSLTAALALPFTLPSGVPLEGRSEVIFMTFAVILMTLLIPGFTLSALIRALKINHHSKSDEVNEVGKQLASAAEEELHRLHHLQNINDGELEFLKAYFNLHRRILEKSISTHEKMDNLEIARLKALQAQRKTLFRMWDEHQIDDKLLTELEQQLDVEETHTARAELV